MYHGGGWHQVGQRAGPRGRLSSYLDEEEILGRVYEQRVVVRLWRYLSRYKSLVIVGLLCTLLSTLAIVASPWLIGTTTDRFIRQGNLTGLDIMAAIFIGNGLLGWLAGYWQRVAMARVSQGTLFAIRTDLFDHLQELSLSFFDHNEVGRIMSRVQNDVQQLQELLTFGIVGTIADLLTLIGIVAFMVAMDLRLSLITFAALPILIITMSFWQVRARSAFTKARRAIALVNAGLQENISGVRVVQSLSREELNSQLFDTVNEDNLQANLEAGRLSAAILPVIEIMVALAIAMTIVFGGSQVLSGSIEVGVLIAFTLYIQRFFEPIRDLTMQYSLLQRAMASGVRIFELLDTQPEIKDASDSVDLPEMRGEVRFNNVSFSYVDGVEVLHGVNLEIKPGESVALVGQTGAGKSTIAGLLFRFYGVTSGSIEVDGIDIRRISRKSLARHMSIILQDPFLFSGTIKDNIRYGKLQATDDEIMAAASAVGAHQFISSLENGYDTEVHERGMNLSLGQRQLICFARAMLAEPKILILDEATASVDSQTEALIQGALRSLLKGRTSIIIAHRPSTIKNADRVIVLDDGRVVEEGTPQELFAGSSYYSRLYSLSFDSEETELESQRAST